MKSKLIEVLRTQLGVKWQHQGRLPGVALDCAGLVVWAARECGVPAADLVTYERRPDANVLLAYIEKSGLSMVSKSNLEIGDLLVMQYDGNPQHLAVVTDITPDGHISIIHAAALARKVVEHLLTDDWRDKVVYVYRFPF